MAIRFFNSMGNKKEEFKPLKPGEARIYNCGLTVYDFPHIGNLRAYTFADLLRRWLEYREFKVRQVMNFTDVGHITGDELVASAGNIDRMEKAAKREHKSVWDVARFYIEAAMKDYRKMNFLEPEVRPRATNHIKEMIEIIEGLVKKGYAYVSNGSVYYDISKFKDYGKLSGNTPEQLRSGAGGRVEENTDKKNPFDFALWVNDPQHIMHWESPWSVGYPGWHIECSAMSRKYLGDTLDIHTGGVDNKFPHHECEIAQSEAFTGKVFSRYWMHLAHLMVNGQKMSKSLGNFYKLDDIEKKGFSPMVLRYLYLSSHYRSQLNLTDESMKAAQKTLESLYDFVRRLNEVKNGAYNEELARKMDDAKKNFEEAMDDDLNSMLALSAVFEFVREVNKAMEEKNIGEKNSKETRDFFMKLDSVLGLKLEEETKREKIPDDIKSLAEKRETLRKEKKFREADEVRKQVLEKGWVIEDTKEGIRLRKA